MDLIELLLVINLSGEQRLGTESTDSALIRQIIESYLLEVEFILAFINRVVPVAVDEVEIHLLLSPKVIALVLIHDVLSVDKDFPFFPRELLVLIKVVCLKH